MKARNGDHLMVPFECDTCIFRKLRKENPNVSRPADELLMATIRRANLDAFWSRTSSTVHGNKSKISMALELSHSVGLQGPFASEGPYPPHDHCGYEIAVQMLLHSRRKGNTARDHLQFESIRHHRSAISNVIRASVGANTTVMALGDTKGKYQRFATDICGSFWFYRFIEGCRYRMGQDWRPNQALSTDLLAALLLGIRARMEGCNQGGEEENRWIVFYFFVVATYVISLRGPEGLLLDLDGIRRYKDKGDGSYCVFALLGKVKGEHHDRCHIIPCSNVTSSGIDVKEALDMLVSFKEKIGFIDGPAISNRRGEVYGSKDLDDALHEILSEIFDNARDLFPPHVKSHEDIREKYKVFRTLRRTSDTRAVEMNVSKDDINVVNRWEQVERSSGRSRGTEMRFYYADFGLLSGPFKRYTSAM